eukprot:1446079-Amphidinium_carterae.1
MQELRSGEDANHGLMNPLSASWGDHSVPGEDARGLGSVGKVTHSISVTEVGPERAVAPEVDLGLHRSTQASVGVGFASSGRPARPPIGGEDSS